MTIENLALNCANKIFNNVELEPRIKQFAKELSFVGGKVKAIKIKCENFYLTVLEQNPNKIDSKYAEMAKNGNKIAWVLQNEQYIGRIENDNYIKL